MAINLKNKAEIVEKYGKDSKDTGSVDVQVALLTEKINELTEHLKANPKDFQGRRGLLMMVGRRKNLLAYLKKVDLERYRTLIKKLNLRG
ncbi:30S ribosomal protein S15 [bacterium]|nr:30S ribosomal protein S15 [bacterium]